jgi:hypothetical protein
MQEVEKEIVCIVRKEALKQFTKYRVGTNVTGKSNRYKSYC